MSVVLDLISWQAGGSRAAVEASYYAILIGLLGVLIAVPTGFADWMGIKSGNPARRIGLVHAGGMMAAALMWLVNLILRGQLPASTVQVPGWAVLFSLAGVALVLASAYLGGRMVYGFGIGVGRFSKKELRATAEAAGSRVPPEKKG